MPMMRDFVPECIRPWIYVLTACCFQFSGCYYLGALDEIRGTTGFMIEDILMMLYAGLAGMAIWFPVLFRTKFRFTNRFLLCTSAIVVAVCNLLLLHTTFRPLMWVLCFLSGIAKIQGTFECMSNIQLWITPRRDFAVFFPVLHIILFTAIEGTGYLAAWFGYHFTWEMMHVFVVGTMSFVLLTQLLLCQPFCPMPKRIPLRDYDFTGGLMLAILMLMVSYFCIYGDYKMWLSNRNMRLLLGGILILSALWLHRMTHLSKPFIRLRILTFRNVVPIWIVIILCELLLGAEHTLEEILYSEVMGLEELTKEEHMLWALVGVYPALLLTLLWLKVLKWKVWKLLAIGFLCVTGYSLWFYFHLDMDVPYEQLRLGVALRGAAMAIFGVTLMWSLDESLDFEHFFMGLCIFNVFHMYLAGAAGYGIYTTGFMHYVNDNMSRYGQQLTLSQLDMSQFNFDYIGHGFLHRNMMAALKQIYGWLIWFGGAFTIAFLCLDIPAVRRNVRRIPSWPAVGAQTLLHIRPLYMKRWFIKRKS